MMNPEDMDQTGRRVPGPGDESPQRRTLADEHEERLKERDRRADEREREADERERKADEREREADEREARLGDFEAAILAETQSIVIAAITAANLSQDEALQLLERVKTAIAGSEDHARRSEAVLKRASGNLTRKQADAARSIANDERDQSHHDARPSSDT
jgi:hypothetical protein